MAFIVLFQTVDRAKALLKPQTSKPPNPLTSNNPSLPSHPLKSQIPTKRSFRQERTRPFSSTLTTNHLPKSQMPTMLRFRRGQTQLKTKN